MKIDSPMPSLEGATEWLNQTKTNPAKAKGRPVLVHFWSLSSEQSQACMPRLAELRDRRKREGLRIIAVHLPGSKYEADAGKVREANTKLNLTEPCALDNEFKLRDAFLNEHVTLPAYFLFDHQLKLRRFSSGKRGLDEVEDQLDQLLLELRQHQPFCPGCELFLNTEALYCSDCGSPLILPGAQKAHPSYEEHHFASLPTVRLKHPDPLIGQTIAGKYKLTACVGEGGMSVVYRAKRLHIGDDVAVKVMLRKFAGDEAALARFRREAGAAAISHHTNVITIHDFGEPGGDIPAYIVMELVKGTPLGYLLEIGTHFSFERAERLMRAICAGVGAAHRREVVHHDLKPDNILVVAPDDTSEFESVRIVDFGFARLMSDPPDTTKGAVIGTPFYMSPEQCLGRPVDATSDVYSLGVVFYELLTGTRPFVSDRVSEIINKHLYETPRPLPPELGFPKWISSGIMQALAKDRHDRPQTATELARKLKLI